MGHSFMDGLFIYCMNCFDYIYILAKEAGYLSAYISMFIIRAAQIESVEVLFSRDTVTCL